MSNLVAREVWETADFLYAEDFVTVFHDTRGYGVAMVEDGNVVSSSPERFTDRTAAEKEARHQGVESCVPCLLAA